MGWGFRPPVSRSPGSTLRVPQSDSEMVSIFFLATLLSRMDSRKLNKESRTDRFRYKRQCQVNVCLKILLNFSHPACSG